MKPVCVAAVTDDVAGVTDVAAVALLQLPWVTMMLILDLQEIRAKAETESGNKSCAGRDIKPLWERSNRWSVVTDPMEAAVASSRALSWL